jgi:predicted HicB family RNase H-like nuclease
MKKKNRIPKFKSLKEEASFWENHSLADYWSDFKDVNLVVELQKPKEETLVLRLQKGIKDKLEQTAQTKGISTSGLVRVWLMEKLAGQ